MRICVDSLLLIMAVLTRSTKTLEELSGRVIMGSFNFFICHPVVLIEVI
jgi:hypothetical protein